MDTPYNKVNIRIRMKLIQYLHFENILEIKKFSEISLYDGSNAYFVMVTGK